MNIRQKVVLMTATSLLVVLGTSAIFLIAKYSEKSRAEKINSARLAAQGIARRLDDLHRQPTRRNVQQRRGVLAARRQDGDAAQVLALVQAVQCQLQHGSFIAIAPLRSQ